MAARASVVALRAKFDQFLPHLDERRRRIYLASEAASLGHGGITLVAAASGASAATIARGIAELSGVSFAGRAGPGSRSRPQTTDGHRPRPAAYAGGADRAAYPGRSGLAVALDHALAAVPGLGADRQGPPVSATAVGRLLHAQGYSLQGTAKTTEGASHPDRDAQFMHINATAAASWTCTASRSLRYPEPRPAPSHNYKPAYRHATTPAQINSDSYSDTSPRQDRERPGRRLPGLRRPARARGGGPGAVRPALLDLPTPTAAGPPGSTRTPPSPPSRNWPRA